MRLRPLVLMAVVGAVPSWVMPGAIFGCARPPASVRAPSAPIVWEYEVRASHGTPDELTVNARFAATGPEGLGVDDDTAPFVRNVTYASGERWIAAAASGANWTVPCDTGCRVQYRYALREAASSLRDPESAMASGGLIIAPPSTWLLRPTPNGGRFHLHVSTEPGWRFATGIRSVSAGSHDTFEAGTDAMQDSSFAAFGVFRLDQIDMGTDAMRVDVAIASDTRGLLAADVSRWIKTSVDALTAFYARPIADHVLVIVIPGEHGNPTRGETLGDGGPAVLIRAAEGLTAAATRDDWVVTHELIHASLPSFGRSHAWLGEGIATYVEPIARVRAGLMSAETFWRDLVRGLPQGLPEAGDEGLERTHTWARTYWGGALFCFAADVAIRERTGNARSFDDALRGIVATGADAAAHWTVQRFIEAGDGATGTRVLEELYRGMGLAGGEADLPRMWQRLGVRVEAGGRVVFDDSAPLAAIRRAITGAPSGS